MGNIPQHLVVLIFIKTLKTELSIHTKLQNVSKEDVPTWCKQFYYDFFS